MDIPNFIRSMIFLTAGLIMIFFPERVYKFQDYWLSKFPIKYNKERVMKSYLPWGIVFIIISIVLFVFSILN